MDGNNSYVNSMVASILKLTQEKFCMGELVLRDEPQN